MASTILLVVQVISALALIGFVLLQQGKGADAGASFGGGASQTVFGSAGSGNFLIRMTAVCAVIFFCCSLALAHLTKAAVTQGSQLNFAEPVLEGDAQAQPGAALPSEVIQEAIQLEDASSDESVEEPTTRGDLPPPTSFQGDLPAVQVDLPASTLADMPADNLQPEGSESKSADTATAADSRQ